MHLQQQQQQQQQQQILQRKGLGNKIDPTKSSSAAATAAAAAAGTAGATAPAIDQLSDALLLNILGRVQQQPSSSQLQASLVCKRWLRLHSVLRTTLRLLDWSFLESGRLRSRFPNLRDINIAPACVLVSPKTSNSSNSSSSSSSSSGSSSPPSSSSILLTHASYTLPLSPDVIDVFPVERCIQEHELSAPALDNGLTVLADSFPQLQRLALVDVYRDHHHATSKAITFNSTTHKLVLSAAATGGEPGLAIVARRCSMLQELEIFQCTDEALNAISACRNLQILSVTGSFTDLYVGSFTDIGLTILANRFSRLVKLQLRGCEASYHGIAAIGQRCAMLEELILSTRGFQKGWVAAVAHCTNLKTLCLESCKFIDLDPGPAEYLRHCPALHCLRLLRCDLRDRLGFSALLYICQNVRELVFQDCWGLEDDAFALAASCRKTRLLSLEGCSLLTASGLEEVVLAWKELQRLRVTFCDSIRDSDVSPALADRMVTLKEFRWRPDTRSMLAASLAGTGVGQKGGRFFKV